MAIAIVQATTADQINNEGAYSLVFGSNITAGSAIIVLGGAWSAAGAGFQTPTDTRGNTYSLADQSDLGATGGGEGVRAAIYYTLNSTAGANTVSWNTVQGNEYGQAIAIEVSGIATSSALDQTLDAEFTRAGSSSACATGTTSTLAQADELVVAVMSLYEFDTNINLGTASSGYTNLYTQSNAQDSIGGSADYKIVADTTAVSATWSHDALVNDGKGWANALATFKAAAAAGAKTMLLMGAG